MSWQLDMVLFVLLLVTAVLALQIRDLLGAVAVLSAYSFLAALLFAQLGAVDVAFVEAVLGSAFTGLLFIAAILRTTRDADEQSGVAWPAALICTVFLALMVFASTGLPVRGDPEAPAHVHVSPHYIERSVEETNTPNIVTAVLADYRSQDTLGETLVIFTAGLACALILRRRQQQ